MGKMGGQESDGTWLCVACQEDSKVWDSQDFSYEEFDKDANNDYAVSNKSGSVKVKKIVKKTRIRDPEYITLSSDEEDEFEDEEVVEESDDEVEFLAEMEGHFFEQIHPT